MIWKPFEVYVCDHCGKTLGVEEGWMEWLDDDDGLLYGWRIVHHRRGCMAYAEHHGCNDNHLTDFVQNNGQNFLGLALVEDDEPSRAIYNRLRVKSYAEFSDMLFRLTMPHYEQARQFFEEERENELFPRLEMLTSQYLLKVISRYEPEALPPPLVSEGLQRFGDLLPGVLEKAREKMKKSTDQ